MARRRGRGKWFHVKQDAMFHVKHFCVKAGGGPENTKNAKQPHASKNQAMKSMT
jgi:hypothetical protein